jgi:hypothetical protein
MQYELRQQDDRFFHVETGLCVGYVAPLSNGKGFSLHRALKIFSHERDQIAVVKSLDEALPKLTDYYEKRWPQWRRTRDGQFDEGAGYTMHTKHIKWTFYGVFTVWQQEDRQWVATRYMEQLLHYGEQATFPTAELAKHVADLHERDGVANYPALDDGYSWEPRRLIPIER